MIHSNAPLPYAAVRPIASCCASLRASFCASFCASICALFSAFNAQAAPGPCTVDPALGNPVYVEMQTSSGEIALELWPDVAPCTINNFLAYRDSGRYDGTLIHRTVDDFVIQGGGYAYDAPTDSFGSILRDPNVVNEPGASNLRGTIAMARVGGQIDSATSEFFINLSDNLNLDVVDEGFTVFGRVAANDLPVVDAIGDLPRVVGRWTLNTPLREVLGELPVHLSPIEPPGGYGCFDPAALPAIGLAGWTRALVNTTLTALEPDPLTGATFFLSGSCSGQGAVGSPSVACTTDRTVAYFNGGWFTDPTPMTCDQIAESEESLASRRNDQQPQITEELVEVSGILVPEPTTGSLLTAGLVGLVGLCQNRNRQRICTSARSRSGSS
ncbi:MAG: peptidylprolyl isomerase [Myxococcota bacterium]